jgi:putative ABC transport system permease protein
MAMLNNDHIDYIIRDLPYRGVIIENCEHEMVDHICSAVEVEMERGPNRRFIDAYHYVLRSFGQTGGLRKTQFEILRSENSTPKLMFRNYLNIAWRNLSKHRFYTFINVAGLAVGIAACPPAPIAQMCRSFYFREIPLKCFSSRRWHHR